MVSRVVQMMCCKVMAWTDERAELKVLVRSSEPIVSTTVVTEEKEVQRMLLTGTAAEKRYMEREWWARLWQTMQRVQNRETARAMDSAAERQCKKEERQTEALLVKACNENSHVFEPKTVESVTRQATLMKA